MRVRRCRFVVLEPRSELSFSLEALLDGETGVRRRSCWVALAPHLDDPVELDASERELLGRFAPDAWCDPASIVALPDPTVDRLLDAGLLLASPEDRPSCTLAEADARLREAHWHGLSAVAHAFSRWEGVDAAAAYRDTPYETLSGMREQLGEPPGHAPRLGHAETPIALPRAPASPLADLMARRVTCRNFDAGRPVDLPTLAHALQRVFGALAVLEAAPGMAVIKKTSPSGGALHPIEALVVARHVDGLAPGSYHYRCVDHALDALAPGGAADPARDDGQALDAVAGQRWFADAPVLVVLVARFARSFWKYRNHAKAYRALLLEAGHLSQSLYLVAAELGLGAFVTAAINEKQIERCFGLDPREHGVVAVCGLGWRGAQRETIELDPQHAVWPVDDAQN